MTIARSLATRTLAAWLILTGAEALLHIAFPYEPLVLGALAAAAGVLLLLGK